MNRKETTIDAALCCGQLDINTINAQGLINIIIYNFYVNYTNKVVDPTDVALPYYNVTYAFQLQINEI